MAGVKELNDVSSAILDMDTLAMDSMDVRPESLSNVEAAAEIPGAESKGRMSTDSPTLQDRDDVHGIEDRSCAGSEEMEFRDGGGTNGDDVEVVAADPRTPKTLQEGSAHDAEHPDEIKDSENNLEEDKASDDEVLDAKSSLPHGGFLEDSNAPDEINHVNVDERVDDIDQDGLGDDHGGNQSLGSEKYVAPFPISRVKRIIKLDKDVRLVTSDAVALVAEASALFVQSLSSASFTVMLRTKRKTIRGPDVVHAAKSTRQFRDCLGNDLVTLLEGSNGDTSYGEDGPNDESARTKPQHQKSASKHQLAAPPGSRPITNFFKA